MNTRDLAQCAETEVFCYIHEIPSFVEKELISLYETLHSSLAFFKGSQVLARANCYVARRHGVPVAIFLFTCRHRHVEVLNEMIEIDQFELDRFVRCIFDRFGNIDVIRFRALKTTVDALRYPTQQYEAKLTYVISLPAKPEEYTASIGKSTRAGLRHQMNNVVRDFATFESKFFVKEEVNEQHVRDIISFNEQKIGAKGIKIAHDIDRIMPLVQSCGFVNVFLIDGRVCAGSINYDVGTGCFGDVIGYDPAYEKYGLGKLCVHQTVCESIRRGARKFYLGGGAFDFKTRMLGVPLSMDELTVYRSRISMLRHLDRALKTAIAGQVVQLKRLLHRHRQKAWAYYTFKAFHFCKNKIVK